MDNTKHVVFLIDVQRRYVDRLSERKKISMLKSQSRVLEHCVRKDVPLVVLDFLEGGETHHEIRGCAMRVPRRLQIKKLHNDGFDGTPLATELRKWMPEYLIMMGLNATACVYDTATSAVNLCYRLAVSPDLIGDMNSRWGNKFHRKWYTENSEYFQNHEELLRWMRS